MRINTTGIEGRSAIVEARRFEIEPYINVIDTVLDSGLYEMSESSINLPSDDALVEEVKLTCSKLKNEHLKYVFLIGIGGSNMGAKAIYDALGRVEGQPQLICFDTVSESAILSLRTYLKDLKRIEEFAVVSISKSGTTTETIMNTEIVLGELKRSFPDVASRTVCITDAETALLAEASIWGAATLSIPARVGGRYSVFSAVGLVPLALCGVDIDQLVAGAQAALTIARHRDTTHNATAESAILTVDLYQQGKTVHDLFFFHPELESLGKWCRQLLAESTGKRTVSDKSVAVAILPTISIGSTDLHSIGQLYLSGLNTLCTTFVHASPREEVAMPTERIFPGSVPMVSGRTIGEVRGAIMSGVEQAYKERHMPFMTIYLEALTEFEIGMFMQHKMIETMFVGRLLDVDPFDQPDVESYKKTTKALLESK